MMDSPIYCSFDRSRFFISVIKSLEMAFRTSSKRCVRLDPTAAWYTDTCICTEVGFGRDLQIPYYLAVRGLQQSQNRAPQASRERDFPMPSYKLSYTYDAAGNRLTRTDHLAGETTTYT
jgi:hypothetical protein